MSYARKASTSSPKASITTRNEPSRRRLPICRPPRNNHFKYPADHDPSKLAEGAFDLIGGNPERVRIVFDKSIIIRRRWLSVDGGIELFMSVAIQCEVRSWLLGLGEKALGMESPELPSAIASEL